VQLPLFVRKLLLHLLHQRRAILVPLCLRGCMRLAQCRELALLVRPQLRLALARGRRFLRGPAPRVLRRLALLRLPRAPRLLQRPLALRGRRLGLCRVPRRVALRLAQLLYELDRLALQPRHQRLRRALATLARLRALHRRRRFLLRLGHGRRQRHLALLLRRTELLLDFRLALFSLRRLVLRRAACPPRLVQRRLQRRRALLLPYRARRLALRRGLGHPALPEQRPARPLRLLDRLHRPRKLRRRRRQLLPRVPQTPLRKHALRAQRRRLVARLRERPQHLRQLALVVLVQLDLVLPLLQLRRDVRQLRLAVH